MGEEMNKENRRRWWRHLIFSIGCAAVGFLILKLAMLSGNGTIMAVSMLPSAILFIASFGSVITSGPPKGL